MKRKKGNKDSKKKDKLIEAKKKSEGIEEIKKQRDEYLAYAQRCRADFLNYKKEEAERMKKIVDYEREEWLLELLRILDHFERAKSETAKHFQNTSMFEGFFQIQKSLENFLKQQGLEEIDSQTGKKFNPSFEEVIETEEDKEKEEGTILEVIQKGYKFKGKILRPARVKVSKK